MAFQNAERRRCFQNQKRFWFARLGFSRPRGRWTGRRARRRRDELERIAVSLRGGGQRTSRQARSLRMFLDRGREISVWGPVRILPLPLWAFEFLGNGQVGTYRTEMGFYFWLALCFEPTYPWSEMGWTLERSSVQVKSIFFSKKR